MLNLSIIFLMTAVGLAALTLPSDFGYKRFAAGGISLLLAILFTASNAFVIVDEGYEGVVLAFGAAKDDPLSPGLNMKMPWEDVVELSVQDVKFHKKYRCSSRDLQEVNVEMTVVYRRKKGRTPDIWRRVGNASEAVDVAPGAQEVLKAVTAKHNATEIVQKRSKLSSDTKGLLREWITDGDLELVDCSLAKSSFTPKFDTAIREKQNALEDANKAVNLLAEAKERAKITRTDAMGEADAKIEEALGEASKIKRAADAEAFEIRRAAEAKVKEIRGVGLAEALRLAKLVEAVELNPGVIELEAIKAWQGSVPQYKISAAGGEGVNLLMQTPNPPPLKTPSKARTTAAK